MIRTGDKKLNLIPEPLLKYQLFKNLNTLYSELPNNDLIKDLSNVPIKPLEFAIESFLDVVNYERTDEEKRYLTKRLLSMRSAEKVLWELEKYTNMVYDKEPDPDSPGELNTRYAPRLLKVVIESIETETPETIKETLEGLFAAVLYYKELDYYIKNLIIRLKVDLKLESNTYIVNAYNLTILEEIV